MTQSIERGEKDSERQLRRFPDVKFWDFQTSLKKNRISVANIQIETPILFLTGKPPRLGPEYENLQCEKILKYVKEALDKGSDLLVIPELCSSKHICEEIRKLCGNSDTIVIMGSFYDEYSNNLSIILKSGQFYGQYKNNPSLEEIEYMRSNDEVNVFLNTPIGNFLCIDLLRCHRLLYTGISRRQPRLSHLHGKN